jgi:hypothetical protein
MITDIAHTLRRGPRGGIPACFEPCAMEKRQSIPHVGSNAVFSRISKLKHLIRAMFLAARASRVESAAIPTLAASFAPPVGIEPTTDRLETIHDQQRGRMTSLVKAYPPGHVTCSR